MKKAFSLFLLSFLPLQAFGGDGDLWVVPVVMMCKYQYPKYNSQNKNLSDAGDFADFRKLPIDDVSPKGVEIAKCFQSAQWISEDLCATVMNTTNIENIQSLYDKHSREIAGFGDLFEYLFPSRPNAQPLACPSHAEFIAKRQKKLDTDISENLACNAVDKKTFKELVGQVPVLEPSSNGPFKLRGKGSSINVSCHYNIDGARYTISLGLNPRLVDDEATNCREATGKWVACRATKSYWNIVITAPSGAPQSVVERLVNHIANTTDFPQDRVEEFRISNHRQAQAAYELELLARSRKEVAEAISEANAALELNPRDGGAYLKRGQALRKSREFRKAIADFTAALALDPGSVVAYVNRGDILLSYRQFDDAIADYNAALKRDPNNIDAHVGRGQIYLSKGETKWAIADFDEALRQNPSLKLAMMHRGNAWLTVGEPGRAIADYSAAVRTYPDWTTVRRLRGFAYFAAGEFALAQADFEELSRATDEFKIGDPELALWLYLVRARLGADARAQLLKDRNLDTSPWGSRGQIGALYAGRSNVETVERYIQRPNTLHWERCQVHFYLGEWSLLNDQREASQAFFKQALESCVGSSVEYMAAVKAELGRMMQ